MTQWLSFLLSIFSNDWVKNNKVVYYDIPSIYLFKREDLNCLSWDITYIHLLDETISEMGVSSFEIIDNEDLLKKYRKIVRDKLLKDNEIDITDASDFIKLVVKNKIWSDYVIRQNQKTVFYYVFWSDNTEVNKDIEEDERSFEEQEKEAWRPYVMPDVQHVLDVINLKLLKDNLVDLLWNSFNPEWWQEDFLTNSKRYNFIAASRRSWKSYMAAYLIIRQLMLPVQSAVVLVPTLKNHAKNVFRYIDRFLNRWWGKKSEWRLDRTDWVIENKETKSTCQFYSAEREDSIRWDFANLLVVDEAAFWISEEMFESALALTRTVKWMVYCISTVNPKTPKNRFYYNLIEAEMEMLSPNPTHYWVRLTIYDNLWIPEDEKKDIIKRWQRNPAFFNAEWMAIFGESDLFSLDKFWIIDEDPVEMYIWGIFNTKLRWDFATGKYIRYFIAHDPGQQRDRAWLIVLWITKDLNVRVLLADYLDWFLYWEQIDIVKSLLELLWPNKTDIVIDYWWVGVWVEQIYAKEKMFVNCVTSVWWNKAAKRSRDFTVGKDLLIWTLQAALSNKIVQGYSFMSKLHVEFETYDQDRSTKWHHNDMISALMIGLWFANKSWFVNILDENIKDDETWEEYLRNDLEKMLWFRIQDPNLDWETWEYDRLRKYWY